jgi:orotate phosphoribosyltransferase
MSKLLDMLKELGGYWKYSGGEYIAELTSGKFSDTFVNTSVLTTKPWLFVPAIEELVNEVFIRPRKFPDPERIRTEPDFVFIGPSMGGIIIAYELARRISGRAFFTEPEYEAVPVNPRGEPYPVTIEKTGQTFKRFEIPEGYKVVFCEDVVTTGKSSLEMIEAVLENDSKPSKYNVIPYLFCLVDRRDNDGPLVSRYGEFIVVSLARVKARTWDKLDEAEKALAEEHVASMHNEDNYLSDDLRVDCELFHKGRKYKRTDGSGWLKTVRPKTNWELLVNGGVK